MAQDFVSIDMLVMYIYIYVVMAITLVITFISNRTKHEITTQALQMPR